MIYLHRSGFTLLEILLIIAVIGMLWAVLYPAYGKYMERADDAARFAGAKEINQVIHTYRSEKDTYPSFSSGLLTSYEWFTHECTTVVWSEWYTWELTMWALYKNYTGKPSPRDKTGGIWPFCYMYKEGDYNPYCANSAGYVLIFATKALNKDIPVLAYDPNYYGAGAHRYCFTWE
jgi:type II secretory pathway pseudopilin PulG